MLYICCRKNRKENPCKSKGWAYETSPRDVDITEGYGHNHDPDTLMQLLADFHQDLKRSAMSNLGSYKNHYQMVSTKL